MSNDSPFSPAQIAAIFELAKSKGILPLGETEEIAAALNSQRPKILLPGDNRELGQFAREIGEILRAQDLFRRDRVPVTVNADKQRLDQMTPECLRTWAEHHLVCYKDKTIGAGDNARTIQIVKTMNVDSARGALESFQLLLQLEEIERLNTTRLPVMTGDGRIELLPPRYFPERKIYTIDDGIQYDETMTVAKAKEVIDDLLSEFPFHDDGRSRSVAVAAMMTVFGACLLNKESARPGFIYTANDSDAGKTLAAKVAIIPVMGKMLSRAMPRHEETRKVLDQLALDARPVILFDNVKGTLGGEDIEAFLSAARWSGRIMGGNGGFEVDQVATVFFTGNDCKPTRDMQQRCLFVELFLAEIDSSKRKINRVLDDATLRAPELRNKVCSALWALVKKWDADGRPAAKTIMPKCPEWSRIIAAIVLHSGYGDPCAKPDIASARGDAAEMQTLVGLLAPEVEGQESEDWKFDMIINEIQKAELFANVELRTKKGEVEALFDGEGNPTMAGRSYFGRLFTKYHTRLFAGKNGERLRFIVEGKGNSRKYLVVNEDVRAAKAAERAGEGQAASAASHE